LIFEIDPDRAIADFDRIGSDLDLGDVEAHAVVELKLPLVPRAGDVSIRDETIMQRRAAMRAVIIDGEEAVGGPEKSDLGITHWDAAAFADRNVF